MGSAISENVARRSVQASPVGWDWNWEASTVLGQRFAETVLAVAVVAAAVGVAEVLN